MNHDEAIRTNLAMANEQLSKIQGNHPTDVIRAATSIANAFMLAALTEAVRELTDATRTSEPSKGAAQLGKTIEFMTNLMRMAVSADTPQLGIDILREALAEADMVAGEPGRGEA